MQFDLSPTPDDSSESKERSSKDEDSMPSLDVQPTLPRPKQFIPSVEPAAEPSAAGDSQEIIQPAAALPVQGEKQASQPANIYTVRQGDNLFDIARNELLQASRYLEILELNREHLSADCTHLTPLPAGLKLKIPAQ